MSSTDGRFGRAPAAEVPDVAAPLCRYVRNKGMYAGPHALDPNALSYDATIWWCSITEKALGPDDRPCGRGRCLAGRSCFEAKDEG